LSFGDSGAEPAKENSYEDAGYQACLLHRAPLVWWKHRCGISAGD
jgi:hypothetical protein